QFAGSPAPRAFARGRARPRGSDWTPAPATCGGHAAGGDGTLRFLGVRSRGPTAVSVRPALALWLKPSPDGLRLGSRECGRPRRPFNDFRRLIGLSREHVLNGLDGLLDLLVGHRLDGT